LSELDTQLELAILLGYLSEGEVKEVDGQLVRVDKMLTGLIRSLQKNTGLKQKTSRA
jgi:four helix bundle protein